MNNQDWIYWAKASGAASFQYNTAILEVTTASVGPIPEDLPGSLSKYLEDTHGLTGSLNDKLFRFIENRTEHSMLINSTGAIKGYVFGIVGALSDDFYKGIRIEGIYVIGSTMNLETFGNVQIPGVTSITLYFEDADFKTVLVWNTSVYSAAVPAEAISYLNANNGNTKQVVLNIY